MSIKGIFNGVTMFVTVFLFFALVGFFSGYDDDARQEVVQKTLLKDIHLRQKDDIYFFEYYCPDNKKTFVYSIDDDRGKFLTPLSISELYSSQQSDLTLPTERINENTALISAILGGAGGGFKLQTVLKKPSGGWTWKHLKNTIIGIVGTITGYYTGYWMGSHYDTACNSNFFISVMEDPNRQLDLERARLLVSMKFMENLEGASLSPSGQAINAWDKNPIFMCSPELRRQKEALTVFSVSEKKDPSSKHFHLLNQMESLYIKISQTSAYRRIVENNKYKQAEQLQDIKTSTVGLGKKILEKEKEWDKACLKIGIITL